MKENKAGIAELKARLSHYLRLVRGGGSVTVYDRDRPIARLVPVETPEPLTIRRPPPGTPRPGDFQFLPPLKGVTTDIVELLMEERGER